MKKPIYNILVTHNDEVIASVNCLLSIEEALKEFTSIAKLPFPEKTKIVLSYDIKHVVPLSDILKPKAKKSTLKLIKD